MLLKKTLVLLTVLNCLNIVAQENSGRKYLTGNWNHARDSLLTNGISINPRVTIFNQNFVVGTGDNKSVFNGKAELDVKLNGKLLGIKSWTLVSKLDYNFGKPLLATGSTLIPTNTAIIFPGWDQKQQFDISSLYVVYAWKPGNQVLFGKINMIDLSASTTYSGGAGIDAFWNIGIAAPVSGITPGYILGSIAKISGKKMNWTFMVYDPISAVNKSGFESPFSEGLVLSVSPSWKLKIGNQSGSHAIRLAYSTQNGNNLYNLGDITPPVGVPLTQKQNRFYVSYSFNHPLKKVADTKGWGIFGQVAFSDGNPNPVDYSFLIGVGGNGLINNRIQDKWGIALFSYSLSSIIDDIALANNTPLRNELGLETFYQYWVTPWFSVGGDIQVINPILKKSETAIFLGLRSSIKF